MALKDEIRWFEKMLKAIDSYKVRDGQVIKDFAFRYDLSLEAEDTPRPTIRGTSTSEVIREIREGRWRRYI
jgi:hypothetical protein